MNKPKPIPSVKMKKRINWQLTLLRDKPYMPEIVIKFLDYLRYEWFYTYEEI